MGIVGASLTRVSKAKKASSSAGHPLDQWSLLLETDPFFCSGSSSSPTGTKTTTTTTYGPAGETLSTVVSQEVSLPPSRNRRACTKRGVFIVLLQCLSQVVEPPPPKEKKVQDAPETPASTPAKAAEADV